MMSHHPPYSRTKGEREDLQRLVRQRENVLKSAAATAKPAIPVSKFEACSPHEAAQLRELRASAGHWWSPVFSQNFLPQEVRKCSK
jgi:hypothetical protein